MKVVISGFYGLGNTGDEAILESIVDNLRSEVPNIDITVFSLSPEQTAKEHNVKTVYRAWRRENKEKIRALRQADVLISGGGGLLQDTYPTKFLFGPLPYYLIIAMLAKVCGARVMFFSQGIGPVTSGWGKFLMRRFANKADFITVRDQYSKDYLESLGVTKPETVVTADIVFAFQQKPDDACMKSLPLTGSEQLAAISVRPWFEHNDYEDKLASALDELIETDGITPVFVPMEGHHDVDASKRVLAKMQHAESCFLLAGDFTPNQYLNFISACDITVGLRLHSLIFSALSGVPHIGISYDKKVESLLKRSGMWEYSFRLEELDRDKLVQNTRHVLKDRDNLRRTVTKNAAAMRQEALENIELLKKRFGQEMKK